MKENIIPALRLTLFCCLFFVGIYPVSILTISLLAPGKGEGVKVTANGRVVGYALEGQSFTAPNYFWGRPSAVSYNAAGSAGSNKGPNNPDYLQGVKETAEKLAKAHPGVVLADIPSEMVTASGSGLDPDISPASAYLQVGRIATARHMEVSDVRKIIADQVKAPLLGLFGTETVNVLSLNLELDKLQK